MFIYHPPNQDRPCQMRGKISLVSTTAIIGSFKGQTVNSGDGETI